MAEGAILKSLARHISIKKCYNSAPNYLIKIFRIAVHPNFCCALWAIWVDVGSDAVFQNVIKSLIGGVSRRLGHDIALFVSQALAACFAPFSFN